MVRLALLVIPIQSESMQRDASAESAGSAESGRSGGPPVRYLLIAGMMILGGVAYLDRTNISIAGGAIARDFGIDNPHLGWVISAFLVGYAAFQVPGGLLARRFGPRAVLALGLLWWGVFTALTTWVPPRMAGALFVLLLIRFTLGAGEAVLYPCANQFIERWFPITERGKANGIVFGGTGLGSAVAPPLITALQLRHGWHASFWFCAVLGVLAGAVWYAAARNTPESHPWVRAAELARIVGGREDAAHNSAAGKAAVPWRGILTSPDLIAVSASYFTYGYVSWIFFSWFYLYLNEVRGLSLRTSAIYSIFPFAAMTIGSITGGAISDWLAKRFSLRAGRCLWPAGALGLTALLIGVGSRVHHVPTASLVLSCGAGALYLSQSCFFSFTADFGGTYAGVVSGSMNMCCQIGGAITASLTPLIAAHFGWQASFSTATALAVVGGLAWMMVDPSKRLTGG
jgi:ACS family glucarate transporter-like MFS transporter